MNFEELKVKPEIVTALADMGIVTPTLIQEKAIPEIKAGRDVIGKSKTGSGKTAAFGVPILEKIVPGKGIQALILAPTRELAVQIAKEMQKFGKNVRFSIATVYGGVSINPQIDELQTADIVVATPGRLLDHINRRTINLTKVNCFVLDEADKMVEMGFIEDVTLILDRTPKGRQILLFGATLSDEIKRLQQKYMRNPALAKAEEQVEEDYLQQFYYNVQPSEKFSLLVHLLKKQEVFRAIIFCSARSTVELVARNLRAQGVKSEMIHGKLSQNKRLSVIENLNKGRTDVIVASAVAARGLDIKDVTHIINYDLSKDPQEYIHRIGRTARAGESGKAITLLSQRDHDAFSAIQSRYPVNVQLLPKEEFPQIGFRAREQRGFNRFGRDGFRGGYRGGFRSTSSRSYGRNDNREYGRSEGVSRNDGFRGRHHARPSNGKRWFSRPSTGVQGEN
jgi:superfamily II DNA/RNA helicase